MSLTLERDKVYRARNGSVWRVVCVDGPSTSPIIGHGKDEDGQDEIQTWCSDGRWQEGPNSIDHPRDLIAEHREPREWTLGRDSPGERWQQVTPNMEPYKETVRVREVLP